MAILKKQKICKGNYRSGHFKGCGELKYIKMYGLCASCFVEWCKNTQLGSEWITKSLIPKVKKDVKANKLKEKKAKKDKLKSKSDYEKELQIIINRISRLIDEGKSCISCEHGENKPFTRQKHGSHYYSVGSNPTLRFNLHNIHMSCSICNNYKHGNLLNYDIGIKQRYSEDYLKYMQSLPKEYKALNLHIHELKEAILKAKKVEKEIKKGNKITRTEINNIIGIY